MAYQSRLLNNLVACTLAMALALLYSSTAAALEFSLHKLRSGVAGPTLLVVGGIQGDEPGGFTAASLLVNNYQINRGEVWVVPNLNFDSIMKHSRGINGDLNRKFSELPEDDPDFQTIARIKSIIKNHQVSLVLNLHDGSGFYNNEYIDKHENSERWGQSIVIDQATVEADSFGNIETIANQIIARVNIKADSSKSRFKLNNTRTREGDKEMKKTLSYFAIKNGKPSMGVEASKHYPTHTRTLQLLRVVESTMDTMGIGYSRNFDLNADAVQSKIGENIQLTLFDNKVMLDLNDSRDMISFVPMKKDSPVDFSANNPIVAVVKIGDRYKVKYGNRGVTILDPEYLYFDDSLKKAIFQIDGKTRVVQLGTMVNVGEFFSINRIQGQRVNVIGYINAERRNEAGITIRRSELIPRFSVDKHARKFRVEFYKGEKYSGMVLVNFDNVYNKLAKNFSNK